MSDEPDEKPKNAFGLASADSFVSRHFMPLKAVRVAVLDEFGEPVEALDVSGRPAGHAVASGFLMQEGGGLFLYTCWHVVTGIDLHRPVLPGAISSARRMRLRLSMQAYESRSDGANVFGGQATVDVDLYDTSTEPPRPLWEQDDLSEKNEALSLANLAQPYWHDVVRIRLPDEVRPSELQVLTRSDLGSGVVFPGDSLLLVGYPYGYSVMEKQPTPIVLKRSVAAAWGLEGSRRREILLDGGGAPGMSGGPVFRVQEDKLYLFGIYTGILFPDAPCTEPRYATALGSVCDLSLIPHLPFARAAIPR
jgi:Trypsin-like peptidase domain